MKEDDGYWKYPDVYLARSITHRYDRFTQFQLIEFYAVVEEYTRSVAAGNHRIVPLDASAFQDELTQARRREAEAEQSRRDLESYQKERQEAQYDLEQRIWM